MQEKGLPSFLRTTVPAFVLRRLSSGFLVVRRTAVARRPAVRPAASGRIPRSVLVDSLRIVHAALSSVAARRVAFRTAAPAAGRRVAAVRPARSVLVASFRIVHVPLHRFAPCFRGFVLAPAASLRRVAFRTAIARATAATARTRTAARTIRAAFAAPAAFFGGRTPGVAAARAAALAVRTTAAPRIRAAAARTRATPRTILARRTASRPAPATTDLIFVFIRIHFVQRFDVKDRFFHFHAHGFAAAFFAVGRISGGKLVASFRIVHVAFHRFAPRFRRFVLTPAASLR